VPSFSDRHLNGSYHDENRNSKIENKNSKIEPALAAIVEESEINETSVIGRSRFESKDFSD
jgi:hypothetical protein